MYGPVRPSSVANSCSHTCVYSGPSDAAHRVDPAERGVADRVDVVRHRGELALEPSDEHRIGVRVHVDEQRPVDSVSEAGLADRRRALRVPDGLDVSRDLGEQRAKDFGDVRRAQCVFQCGLVGKCAEQHHVASAKCVVGGAGCVGGNGVGRLRGVVRDIDQLVHPRGRGIRTEVHEGRGADHLITVASAGSHISLRSRDVSSGAMSSQSAATRASRAASVRIRQNPGTSWSSHR